MVNNQIECYKQPWLLQEIRKAVNSISSRVSNTERVENRVMNHVGQYLVSETSTEGNKRYIRRLIYQEINFALKRSRLEQASFLIDMNYEDEEGQAIEYEPEDVLADINSENLEIKETINLLAKDDRRNKMILNAWANGYTEAKEISSILADALGGNSESHRKHIQRFRKKCRAELTAQVI